MPSSVIEGQKTTAMTPLLDNPRTSQSVQIAYEMTRNPPSRGTSDYNNSVSATPKGKKNGEEDPDEYSDRSFSCVFPERVTKRGEM